MPEPTPTVSVVPSTQPQPKPFKWTPEYSEAQKGIVQAFDKIGLSKTLQARKAQPQQSMYYGAGINKIVPAIDRYWGPKNQYLYWQDPQRVARFYQLIENAPKEWQPPEWLDTTGVTALYNYYKDKNPGKPWYDWNVMSNADPAMEYLYQMPLPPPDMMFRGEEIYGKEYTDYFRKVAQGQVPEDEKMGLGDWTKLKAWQQFALFLFSPQPMDNRPDATRLAPVNAALQGLGGAAVGAMLGGPAGAAVGFLGGTGLAMYSNITGQKIPLLSDLLYAFNKPAEWFEQGWGVARQAASEDWELQELIDNFGPAWQAAKLNYEAYGGPGQEMLNMMARVSGDEPAKEGQAWMLHEGYSDPQQIEGPRQVYALNLARQRMESGEDALQVYLDMADNWGYGGTLNDFIEQSLFDPMQFANLIQAQVGGKVAKGMGFERGAAAFDAASGRWYIDVLPIGVQSAVTKGLQLAGLDAYYYKGSSGLLGAVGEWKRWIREGGWPEGAAVIDPAHLPKFEKFLGGLNAEGMPKDLLKSTNTGPGVMNFIKGLSELDPPSKVYAMSDIVNKNVGMLVNHAENTAEIKVGIGKIAGLSAVEAGELGETIMKSPEVAAAQAPIRDFYNNGRLETMLSEYEGVSKQRALLESVAGTLKKTTGEVLELIRSKPDEAARIIGENQAAAAAVKSYGIDGTGADLQDTFKPFLKDDATPWDLRHLKAEVMNALNDSVDQFTTKYFDVKPDHWVYRMTNLMKGVQSLLMLNTMSYLTQNVVNNAVMKGIEGVGGYMTPRQVDTFLERAGVGSYRLQGEIGSVSQSYEANIPAIVKARESADFIGKAQKTVRKVNGKLAAFRNLSGVMEKNQGRAAVATGYLKMWSNIWRYGKQIPEMPATLSNQLDQYAPGFKRVLISAAEGGMNMAEIYKAVQKPMNRRSVNAFITDASKTIFPSAPEIGEDMFTATGLRQQLETMLGSAETQDQADAFFTLVRDEMTNKIDILHSLEIQERAKEVASIVKTEGWKAAHQVFGELKAKELIRRLEHYELAHKVAEEALTLEFDEGSRLWNKFFQEESIKFKRDQEFQIETMAGIIRGLGMDSPEAKRMVQIMTEYYRHYRDFFDGYDVDSRNGRRLTPEEATAADLRNRKHVDGKRDILRKYHNGIYNSKAERRAARADAYARIKDLWNQQLDLAKSSQMEMDGIFENMWEVHKPGEGPKAREWRQNVQALTDSMYREFEVIWDEIQATSNPTKVNQIWADATNKVINPMLKELIEVGEIEGLNKLINGRYEGVQVEEGAPRPPGPMEAPTGRTAVDTQAIADQVGTHANTQRVLSEAEQIKRDAAQRAHAKLTRSQVKQQLQAAFPNVSYEVVHAVMYLMDLHAKRWAEINKMEPGEQSLNEWYSGHVAKIMREGENFDPIEGLDQLYQDVTNSKWYYSKLEQVINELPDVIEAIPEKVIPDKIIPPKKPGKWMEDPNLPPAVRKAWMEGEVKKGGKQEGLTAGEALYKTLKDAGVTDQELRWSLPDSVVEEMKTKPGTKEKVTEYRYKGFADIEKNGRITKADVQRLFDTYKVDIITKTLGENGVNPKKALETYMYLHGFRGTEFAGLKLNLLEKTIYYLSSDGLITADPSSLNGQMDGIEQFIRDANLTEEQWGTIFGRAAFQIDQVYNYLTDADFWDEMVVTQLSTDDLEIPTFKELTAQNIGADELTTTDLLEWDKRLDGAIIDGIIDITDDAGPVEFARSLGDVSDQPKYKGWTPNYYHENYREILFSASRAGEDYSWGNPHYGPETIAHARLADVQTPDNKKLLYINEIQSDYAQQARDQGYLNLETTLKIQKYKNMRSTLDFERGDIYKKMTDLESKGTAYYDPALVQLRQASEKNWRDWFLLDKQIEKLQKGSNIQEFPNMGHWEEMVLKKIIHMAATEGYDGIAWTDAAEQFKLWGSERFEWRITQGPEKIKIFVPHEYKDLLRGSKVSAIDYNQEIQVKKLGEPNKIVYQDTPDYEAELSRMTGLSGDELIIALREAKRDAFEGLGVYDPDRVLTSQSYPTLNYRNIEEYLIGIRPGLPDPDGPTIRAVVEPFTDLNAAVIRFDIRNGKYPNDKITFYADVGLDYKTDEVITRYPDAKFIELTGKEQYGGAGAGDITQQLGGMTIEEFAEAQGRQTKTNRRIQVTGKKPNEIRKEIIQALEEINIKKGKATRYANKIMESSENAGVIMPRYEGMKAAYDIRTPAHLNKMVKGLGGDVEVGQVKLTKQETKPRLVTGELIDSLPSARIRDGGQYNTNMLYLFTKNTDQIDIDNVAPGKADRSIPISNDQARAILEAAESNNPEAVVIEIGELDNSILDNIDFDDVKFMLEINKLEESTWNEPRQTIKFNDQMRESLKAGQELFQHKPAGIKESYAKQIINDIENIGFLPARAMVEIIGGEAPHYLYDVQEFILNQRKKLLNGELTTRDVAKAWIETVSSMRQTAVKYDGYQARLQELMPGYEFEIPDYFKVKINGVDNVRPEEVTAAWLLTPEGKKALDNLEAGRFDPADFETMLAVRDAMGGFNPVREWLFGPNKGGQLTLNDIQKITDQINDYGMQGSTEMMGEVLQQLIGIGKNKTGFIKHLLGMGDSPTLDAREINVWITGKGDISKLEGPAADTVRKLNSRSALMEKAELNEFLEANIKQRFNELRTMGIGVDFDQNVYEHIMHHWIWDAVKQTETTHKGMYEAMMMAQNDGRVRKGSTSFLADGRAIIKVFKAGDVTTVVHELGHVFRRDLSDIELDVVAKFGGLTDVNELKALENKWQAGTITQEEMERLRNAEEKFAYGWEIYMGEHKDYVPPAMQPIFGKFTTWIQDIYKNVVRKLGITITEKNQDAWKQPIQGRTGDLDLQIPVGEKRMSMRQIFDNMLFDDNALQARQGYREIIHTRPAGNQTVATGTLDANANYNFRFRLVDLADLVTSHDVDFKENPIYPRELQNKDRASFANQKQVHDNAMNLAPNKLLLDPHNLQEGPPIILADGTVISGNGRVNSIREATIMYPAKYQAVVNQLKNDIEAYGFTPADLEGLKQPVLVRELTDQIDDLVLFSKDANQRPNMETTPSEKAMDDAYLIGDDVIQQMELTPGQTLDQSLINSRNIPFVMEFLSRIPQGDTAGVIDKNGLPSAAGIRRMKNAMFASTYQGEAGSRLLRLFSDTEDVGMKNLETAMFDTIGMAAQVEALIRSGARDTNLSLAKDLSWAADQYYRLKQQNIDPNIYLNQYTADTTTPMDPFQAEMLRMVAKLSNSVGKMREILGNYYASILQMPPPSQDALVGEARPGKGALLDGVTSKYIENPNFTDAEAASAKGDLHDTQVRFDQSPVEFETMLPKKFGEYLVDRRYHRNYHDIAYLTPEMQPDTTIDTVNGPARLLGLDPDDPTGESYVYEMQDGSIHSTRQPADDGLYQTLYGHEKFRLPENPNDTENILDQYDGEPSGDFNEKAWLLPDGKYIDVIYRGKGTKETGAMAIANHTDFVEPGYGLEEGSMAISDGGDHLVIDTLYMPTQKQIEAIANRIAHRNYKSIQFGLENVDPGMEGGRGVKFPILTAYDDEAGGPGNLMLKLSKFLGDLEEGNPRELYQEATMPRSMKQEVLDNANKIFGTTEHIDKAGWILPDGTMLDFNRRKPIGQWTEHTEIIRAFPEYQDVDLGPFGKGGEFLDYVDPDTGLGLMVKAMEIGMARTYNYTRKNGRTVIGVENLQKLTQDQIVVLLDAHKRYDIELSDEFNIFQISKDDSTEQMLQTIDDFHREVGELFQDDPIQGLFDDVEESRGQQPPQPVGPEYNDQDVWRVAATHKNSQGKADLTGIDENGNVIPEAKFNIIKFIRKWGNPNDRRRVTRFEDITPDILQRAITREQAYLLAQMRLDMPPTTGEVAPIEGQYEDQMPANLYEGRAMDELASDYLEPMLDHMQKSYRNESLSNVEYNSTRLPDQVQEGIKEWLGQVETQMPTAKRISLGYGEGQRDAAMLNYSKRVGFDNLIEVFFPYQFWYTRSMMEWSRRMIDNPEWISMYARVRHIQKQNEEKGMPSRLEMRNRLPAAYLPDWMGGGVWFDPYKTLFPIDNFGQPLQNIRRMQSNLERDAEETLYQMAQDGEINQQQYEQALQDHESDIYLAAVERSKESAANEAGDPMTLVSTMMTPALWWTAPYYAMRDQPEKIQVLPMTKQAQAFRYALQGTILEPVGYLLGLAALPEEKIRETANISVFGEFGDYMVDRHVSNIAAEGKYSADEVLNAMASRSGPIYEEAIRRTQQEVAIRYPGMLPLFAVKEGANLKEAITSLIGMLSGPGQLLPEGELRQRAIQGEYSKAWDQLKDPLDPDPEALNAFFRKYPEYRARLLLFKEPEDRLRNHLTNIIWDQYYKLARPNRAKFREQAGTDFDNLFINKETRDYEAIGTDKLAAWAMMLNREIPVTEETKAIIEAGVPQPELYTPLKANMIENYQNERDTKYPNWFKLQTLYYEQPKGAKRKEFLKANPELKGYWDFKHKYRDDHPEIESWFKESSEQASTSQVDISQFDPSLIRQLMMWIYGVGDLSIGAQMELTNQYQEQPGYGTFDLYLDEVKRELQK